MTAIAISANVDHVAPANIIVEGVNVSVNRKPATGDSFVARVGPGFLKVIRTV